MRKIIAAAAIVLAFATFAFAANIQNGAAANAPVNRMEEDGAKVLNSFAKGKLSEKEEYALWKKLWTTQGTERVQAAMALVNSIYPDGDPANLDDVNGMLGDGYTRPRQIAAADAVFVAADELSKNDATVWGAALLLNRFVKSATAEIMFVETTAPEAKAIMDNVVAKTGITPIWAVKKVCGKMPFLPVYDGFRSRSIVADPDWIYLDNYGSFTGTCGAYAWNRKKGIICEIREDRH